MELFLVSDVFGRTPALETIKKALSPAVSGIKIIDPYGGVDHKFQTEALAYAFFMDHVGLKQYQSILTDSIKPWDFDIVLVGFSIGASAIWAMSPLLSPDHVQKAFCFYGSQIRHLADTQPAINIELFFPRQEPCFNVDDLINRLQKKNRVTCEKANGLHGFMNELSPGFDPACYADFIHRLKTALSRLKTQAP
ncbi:MAG: hypothetical protein KKE44_02930 [Proteobacteria bacterium]|nr:hypothetical protein [Pseudomonadota bacterium]MBU1581681.1 hypothetical protein [Pseudomonadota bacterium]MBU2454602.1 hypothetical protein [Pseudomonadota bacterium]MBU2627578.1 hypothetical protein [Pseudomonadota bacterium]